MNTVSPPQTEHVSLTINGSELAVAGHPEFQELESALRSIALSDSPVVIRSPEEVQEHLLNRLHALGRRADLPIHICRIAKEAEELMSALSTKGDTTSTSLGTWALFDIEKWPENQQNRLGELLEQFDLGRLHGRLRHERIPRVMAFSNLFVKNRIKPSLEKRISYFTLTIKPVKKEV